MPTCRFEDDGSAGTSGKVPSAADQEALGEAMSRAEIATAGSKAAMTAADAGKKMAKVQQRKEAEVGKKKCRQGCAFGELPFLSYRDKQMADLIVFTSTG